jgi:hypothetical protein
MFQPIPIGPDLAHWLGAIVNCLTATIHAIPNWLSQIPFPQWIWAVRSWFDKERLVCLISILLMVVVIDEWRDSALILLLLMLGLNNLQFSYAMARIQLSSMRLSTL